MSEPVLGWIILGCLGGYRLHRNDPILLSAWPLALVFGAFTLALGLLEWWHFERGGE